jgi:hypothetical protein
MSAKWLMLCSFQRESLPSNNISIPAQRAARLEETTKAIYTSPQREGMDQLAMPSALPAEVAGSNPGSLRGVFTLPGGYAIC